MLVQCFANKQSETPNHNVLRNGESVKCRTNQFGFERDAGDDSELDEKDQEVAKILVAL